METLTSQLVISEQRNNQQRETWLPTLRQLEVRLMELNASITDAID